MEEFNESLSFSSVDFTEVERLRTELTGMHAKHEDLLRHVAQNYMPMSKKEDHYLFSQLDKYCGSEWRSKYPNYK